MPRRFHLQCDQRYLLSITKSHAQLVLDWMASGWGAVCFLVEQVERRNLWVLSEAFLSPRSWWGLGGKMIVTIWRLLACMGSVQLKLFRLRKFAHVYFLIVKLCFMWVLKMGWLWASEASLLPIGFGLFIHSIWEFLEGKSYMAIFIGNKELLMWAYYDWHHWTIVDRHLAQLFCQALPALKLWRNPNTSLHFGSHPATNSGKLPGMKLNQITI